MLEALNELNKLLFIKSSLNFPLSIKNKLILYIFQVMLQLNKACVPQSLI